MSDPNEFTGLDAAIMTDWRVSQALADYFKATHARETAVANEEAAREELLTVVDNVRSEVQRTHLFLSNLIGEIKKQIPTEEGTIDG